MAKRGKKLTFHGAFARKKDAVAKERKVKRAFIIERPSYFGGVAYHVVTENK